MLRPLRICLAMRRHLFLYQLSFAMARRPFPDERLGQASFLAAISVRRLRNREALLYIDTGPSNPTHRK
jgi:hypothetical protein